MNKKNLFSFLMLVTIFLVLPACSKRLNRKAIFSAGNPAQVKTAPKVKATSTSSAESDKKTEPKNKATVKNNSQSSDAVSAQKIVTTNLEIDPERISCEEEQINSIKSNFTTADNLAGLKLNNGQDTVFHLENVEVTQKVMAQKSATLVGSDSKNDNIIIYNVLPVTGTDGKQQVQVKILCSSISAELKSEIDVLIHNSRISQELSSPTKSIATNENTNDNCDVKVLGIHLRTQFEGTGISSNEYKPKVYANYNTISTEADLAKISTDLNSDDFIKKNYPNSTITYVKTSENSFKIIIQKQPTDQIIGATDLLMDRNVKVQETLVLSYKSISDQK